MFHAFYTPIQLIFGYRCTLRNVGNKLLFALRKNEDGFQVILWLITGKEGVVLYALESLHIHFADHRLAFFNVRNDFINQCSVPCTTVHNGMFQDLFLLQESIKFFVVQKMIQICSFFGALWTRRRRLWKVQFRVPLTESLQNHAFANTTGTNE